MHAMVLNKVGAPIEWTELADRSPALNQIRVTVSACGVCRTDLHVVDGELPHSTVPIIPGHEIVGRIGAIGSGVEGLRRANSSASPGRDIPAASPPIAGRNGRICATIRCSPATHGTAVSRPRRPRTRVSLSRWGRPAAMWHWRLCYAPD
jgi:hypothetical protein